MDQQSSNSFGIIAGNGVYPLLMARKAREGGEKRIVVAAFEDETRPELAELVDDIEWMRVGQLGRMIRYLSGQNASRTVMAGQIAPSNLFNLRPDFKALAVLAKLPQRNAESIFGAIGEELSSAGVELIDATTYLDDQIAVEGYAAGPPLKAREWDDVRYGMAIAKETSRMDIGQSVIVRNGTVLAVEAFEGTNAAIRRGGELGRKHAILCKVSKPNQDMRFDVPVIGLQTLDTAKEANLRAIALEAGKTLILEKEAVEAQAKRDKISIVTIDCTQLQEP